MKTIDIRELAAVTGGILDPKPAIGSLPRPEIWPIPQAPKPELLPLGPYYPKPAQPNNA